MIKVFHIVSHFELGGAERVALNLCKSQNKMFEYHIIEVVKSQGAFRVEYINELERNGISYHQSPISNTKIGILLFPFRIIKLLLKYRPNIIHTHTEIPDFSIFLSKSFFNILFKKIRLIRTIHNTKLWSEWERIGKVVEPFFQKENANVAISISVQSNYFSLMPQSSAIPLIYNGISPEVQLPFDGIKKGKNNILFAGRFEEQKGISELITVIKKADNSNLHFHIIGKGSLKEKIIEELDNNQNVSIYEPIYNLSQYLCSFQFLFMPSNFEGLSILALEASFHKLPAIINCCDGLRDIYPKDWPLMVLDNDISSYLEIFNKISLFDRVFLGESVYKYALPKFSISKMQKEYEKLYVQRAIS